MRNDYIIVHRQSSIICHHGIKGQKWGIRRFQNEDGSLTNAGRQRYGVRIKEYSAEYVDKDSNYVKEQRKILSQMTHPSGLSDMKEKTQPFESRENEIKNDAQVINGGFNGHDLNGRDSNCVLCTTAYELRARGYDVIADKQWSWGSSFKAMTDSFELGDMKAPYNITHNAKTPGQAYSTLETQILKQGEGARGNLFCTYDGGGHSVAYEVVNNRVHYIDGQWNAIYSDGPAKMRFLSDFNPSLFGIVRTDDKQIKENVKKYILQDK